MWDLLQIDCHNNTMELLSHLGMKLLRMLTMLKVVF